MTATSFYSQTINDNTINGKGHPETTNFEVAITTLTPANVAAQSTAAGTLRSAIAGITLGEFGKNQLIYERNLGSADPAASQLAQREKKWLVRYHDATTQERFTTSIGTADLTVLPNHSEFIDISTGVGATFKSAFEAFVKSSSDPSHSVVVDSVQYVGRNT